MNSIDAHGLNQAARLQAFAARDDRPQRDDPCVHEADPHRSAGELSNILLGGQDGLVNTLGVVLGVAAATGETRIVLAAGLAAALAESISMAAVAYTATKVDCEHYEAELQRERRHVRQAPAEERGELRWVFEQKGFHGELLERIVDTISRDDERWVQTMLLEKHQLRPAGRGRALRSGLVVGLAAIVGSLLPLLPFALLPARPAMPLTIVLAGVTLFAFGVYKSRLTVGRPLRSGLEQTPIGKASAFFGYVPGLLFR